MGAFADKRFLVKKGMFLAACLCSALGITLNGIAFGTDYWIVANGCRRKRFICSFSTIRFDYKNPFSFCLLPQEYNSNACNDTIQFNVNYGLFGGYKFMKSVLGGVTYRLQGISAL